MKILLSNDDGINSKPLKILAERLAENNEVLVVAPKYNKSAISHSLTVFDEIKVEKVDFIKNCTAYSVEGTPADCIKFAMLEFKDFDADLVVAGINVGHNIGADILYSGTVSIGYEAAFYGKKTFCFSTLSFEESDYSGFSVIAEKIINKYYNAASMNSIINVNFPNLPAAEIKGVKVAALAKTVFIDEYVKTGNNSYKIESSLTDRIEYGTDLYYTVNGYVSLTPLLYDKTDYALIKEMKDF